MPRLPGIFTDEEYRIVQDMLTLDMASKYHLRRMSPHRKRKERIVAILGRDPWEARQPVPVAAPVPATDEPVVRNRMPSAPLSAPHRHIEINPCVDDDVCLAVRKAAMRPIANTLLDQRRDVPCASCKAGIERARAEAAKKVAHVGALTCSCGEEKTRYAESCHECANERKRVRA